eukprot:TRINITY_DN169_c2_g2_i1.p1 TRINITY_DN169_c2_g2~~TRINITY_DN169_c2_g2_i1.p1  ORF type:complete len:590 (+),score=167.89 TRINITY_DN169_c2_g2_i1:74-1843(+)
MSQTTTGLSSSASAALASRNNMDMDSPKSLAKKKLKKSVENKDKDGSILADKEKINEDKDNNNNNNNNSNNNGNNKEGTKEKKSKKEGELSKKRKNKPRSATHDGVESSSNNSSPQLWDAKAWLTTNQVRKVDPYVWSNQRSTWFSSTAGPPPFVPPDDEGDEYKRYDVDFFDNAPEPEPERKDEDRPQSGVEDKDVNISKNSLTFVTWNVWFGNRTEDAEALRPRLSGLFDIISKLEPDFICLQEVTYPINQILQSMPFFQDKGYWISDPTLIKDSARPYGVMMLSKHPIIELYQIYLPTKLGRYFLLAKTRVNNEVIGVITCHWESLDQNVDVRKKQWQVIYSVMEGSTDEDDLTGSNKNLTRLNAVKVDHAFIMGDCNFASQKERKELIIKRYEDLWKTIKKKKRKTKKRTPKSEKLEKAEKTEKSSDKGERAEKGEEKEKGDKDNKDKEKGEKKAVGDGKDNKEKNGKKSKKEGGGSSSKSEAQGFTFDPERNRMLKKIIETGKETAYKRERVDVILCKSKKWKSEGVQLLGTEPLKGVKHVHKKRSNEVVTEYDEVYPSDHFGLHGKYVWKAGAESSPKVLTKN